jgi:hypothetical protein
MLLVPPRHGKSELASIRLPAWYLGRQPHKQFLSVSATDGLASTSAARFGTRSTAPSIRRYSTRRLRRTARPRASGTHRRAGFTTRSALAVRFLAAAAMCILIDDPFGSMQEAQSELERKNVWDWYTGTAYNRLMPGGAIVVINHRMHEDDLCGRLLAQQAAGGDRWEVVELPAINDNGEALWPDAYPIDALHALDEQPGAVLVRALPAASRAGRGRLTSRRNG